MSRIARIQIEKQDALIGIHTTNAKVSMESKRPQMHTTSEQPQMSTETEIPSFSVDWQRVRNESGLQDPVTKAQQIAGEGQQTALQYTGQVAKEGDYLSKVDAAGNRMAAIESNKNYDSMKEINLGSMPQSLPQVQWEQGFININWDNAHMQVEWDSEYMPTFSVEPHSVEIFLRNKPYIRITVAESGPDGMVDSQI